MALDPVITSEQTDAKSPIDQQLMDAIRENLENFDTRLLLSAGADFSYRINGLLDILNLGLQPDNGLGLDGSFIAQERTLQVASLYIDQMGAGGDLEINVRRLKFLGRPISGIQNIFTANTNSIARGSATLNTQSITKAEADLATQAISYAKIAVNIDNIVQVTGAQLFRINLDDFVNPLDEDYQVGRYIEISGATDPNNNGIFDIKALNKDNGKNIIIENALGTAQIGTGGSVQLLLVAYTFAAAVPDNFAPNEDFVALGHTDVSNDGTFTIYKTNEGGNNILTYRTTALVEQVGAGGQVEILRFQYNFAVPVTGAFVVGEIAVFAAHTNANNDGNFEIKALNNAGGDNIVIYNAAGVLQGGVAGTVDTNRWVYALDADPDGYFLVGDTAVMAGHTDGNNNGNFIVVDVKYLATNNVVIYNANGVEQLGAAGTVTHAQKAITFQEDFSSDFTAGKSSVEVTNTYNGVNDGTFSVVDINRLAISPFNIIVDGVPSTQVNDDGQIYSEVRSIFTAGSLIMDVTQDKQVLTVTNIDGEITNEALAENTILLFDVLQAPISARNIAINIK